MSNGGGVSEPPSADAFFPIRIASLCLDTVTGFDLFLKPQGSKPPVLYRDKSLPFTEEARERLKQREITKLYVSNSQAGEYRRYVQANLRSIIADPAVDLTERAEVLYSSAQDVMKDLMEDPRSGQLFHRTNRLASDAVWFLFNQPASFGSLLKVTSYDYYTYTHCVNVFLFCVALARKMRYGEAEVLTFGTGALLHDVGKCMVPPEVVNAAGKLTPEQWEMMKKHPEFGIQVLREQGIDDPVIHDITLHHHEKVNGKGYPQGLTAKDLSVFARICTIVDIFDALTTRRTYKEAMGSFPALKLMQDKMTDELDPELFRNFIALMGTQSQEPSPKTVTPIKKAN